MCCGDMLLCSVQKVCLCVCLFTDTCVVATCCCAMCRRCVCVCACLLIHVLWRHAVVQCAEGVFAYLSYCIEYFTETSSDVLKLQEAEKWLLRSKLIPYPAYELPV